ncbi:MAG: DMP19 family protein [Acidobacteriota bacterium]
MLLEQIFQIPNDIDFVIALSDRVFDRFANVGFTGLTEAEQTFFCIVSLDGEVNNGGFDQFFFNSSGDYSLPTLPALQRIHADYTANLFKQALSTFKNGAPNADREQRWKQMDEFTDAQNHTLSKLDLEYYEEHDKITDLLCSYARSKKIDFK